MSNQDEDLLFSNDEYQPPQPGGRRRPADPRGHEHHRIHHHADQRQHVRPDPARPGPWKREKNLRAKTTPGHLTGGCSDAGLMRRQERRQDAGHDGGAWPTARPARPS